MNSKQADMPEESGLLFSVRVVVLIVALLAPIYVFIFIMGGDFLENLERLQRGSIYVSVSSWDLPCLISIPAFLALVAALLFRLFKAATEVRINACLKIALAFAGLALFTKLIYGFSASFYLQDKGYSACAHYSSPSLMSPVVWVSDAEFCVPNAGKVRSDVLLWMDSFEDKSDVSSGIVRNKVDSLIKSWEMKEREKFPDLYR
ncbi:hypothetical protein OLMES_5145 [Oleiphilus messinensis]|uniref:DUF1240 domain-containing protein n=2 Tax=Oleiphilus messinensis TaxID=141451 RepID=A0A1Y0IG72_9GAMM|nr:hypothetical protein OLMES_5145 [Oleiphilus messinensis]